MKPSQEYTIKILSPEDYDNLPYAGARTSMGMSVMKTKTAYVRSTGVKDLDRGTIDHEFDELMQQTSPHEIDGIRYKSGAKLGRILGPIIGVILSPFITPAGGAAVAAAIAGGTQAHSQSVKPEKYGTGFGGIAKAGGIAGLGAFAGGSLLSAGNVAATNAAIAGQTAGSALTNTGATLAAGLKGAGAAAISSTGLSALSGVSSALAPDPSGTSPFEGFGQPQAAPDQFTASQTSSAFAPQTASALTRPDFDASIVKLAKNAASQEQNVFKAFRGQTPKGNTAFNTALTNSRTSSKLANTQFLDDQRKLGSTFA